jgi:membrane-bound serine protease (ClpP class)
MKKAVSRGLTMLAAALALAGFIGTALASGNAVTVIEVRGEVTAAMTAYISGALDEAEAAGTPVVLNIDTYGGQILEADNIKKRLLEATVPVDAYISGNALSAGTLLAISCERIVMAPSAVMGAAETIPNDEKTLSTWVGILKSAAEARGRDANVVAAMADKRIEIEGLTGTDELLTLSADTAQKWGLSDGTASTQEEALTLLGYGGYAVTDKPMSFEALAAQFLTSTSVASILFLVAIVCMGIELFTPGFGVFGIVSIVCFALYFGGSLLAGYAEWWSGALLVGGIVLIGIELIVPGFGFFGIAGTVCLLAGLFFVSRDPRTFLTVLAVGTVGAAVLLPLLFKLLKKLGLVRKVVLGDNMLPAEGYVSHTPTDSLVGQEGVADTVLRPAGVAVIGGVRQSVVSSGAYIERGTSVVVVEHTPGRIVVEEKR